MRFVSHSTGEWRILAIGLKLEITPGAGDRAFVRQKGVPLLLCGCLAFLLPVFSGASEDPAAVAKEFYTGLRSRGVDGLPRGADWEALVPAMSGGLASAFGRARDEQTEAIRRNPDEKPPWIEGDLFSSLFEGPQTYEFGPARVEGDRAEVPVTCSHTEAGDTVTWTDVLVLERSSGEWRIDDVVYGGSWDFAAKGTLRQSLGESLP